MKRGCESALPVCLYSALGEVSASPTLEIPNVMPHSSHIAQPTSSVFRPGRVLDPGAPISVKQILPQLRRSHGQSLGPLAVSLPRPGPWFGSLAPEVWIFKNNPMDKQNVGFSFLVCFAMLTHRL